jgi:hypothetical protein
MKHILLAVAIFCLMGCLWSSWSFFLGNLQREVFLSQVQWMTLGWFIMATRWAYRK